MFVALSLRSGLRPMGDEHVEQLGDARRHIGSESAERKLARNNSLSPLIPSTPSPRRGESGQLDESARAREDIVHAHVFL